MTKSTGQRGLILAGSPPNLCIASLMAARSTTAGTPLFNSKRLVSFENGIKPKIGLNFYNLILDRWNSYSWNFLIETVKMILVMKQPENSLRYDSGDHNVSLSNLSFRVNEYLREILKDNSSWLERNISIFLWVFNPIENGLNIVRLYVKFIAVSDGRFEKHSDRVWKCVYW